MISGSLSRKLDNFRPEMLYAGFFPEALLFDAGRFLSDTSSDPTRFFPDVVLLVLTGLLIGVTLLKDGRIFLGTNSGSSKSSSSSSVLTSGSGFGDLEGSRSRSMCTGAFFRTGFAGRGGQGDETA